MLDVFLLGFALAASPGPDFLLVARNTIGSGRAIGYLTLLGNRLSFSVHLVLALAGLSAILQASSTLYLAVRILGAGYLVWLGTAKLRSSFERAASRAGPGEGTSAGAIEAFRQGFLGNLLNPKVSLFFLSLFPQVASQDELARSAWQVALALFAGNTSWWVPLVFVLGAARVRGALERIRRLLDLVVGVLFVGFGLRILKEVLFDRAAV